MSLKLVETHPPDILVKLPGDLARFNSASAVNPPYLPCLDKSAPRSARTLFKPRLLGPSGDSESSGPLRSRGGGNIGIAPRTSRKQKKEGKEEEEEVLFNLCFGAAAGSPGRLSCGAVPERYAPPGEVEEEAEEVEAEPRPTTHSQWQSGERERHAGGGHGGTYH